MHISHDNGTVLTGEVMNWNVSLEDAERIILATEKGYIREEISKNESLIDKDDGEDEDNAPFYAEIAHLNDLLDAFTHTPPVFTMDGRVGRYLSTFENGSGYIFADGSWPA